MASIFSLFLEVKILSQHPLVIRSIALLSGGISLELAHIYPRSGHIYINYLIVKYLFLKKMYHLSFTALVKDSKQHRKAAKCPLFHCINEMTSDKRWQVKFSGFVSCWKQFLWLKNCRSVRICSVLNRSNRDTKVYYRLIFCAFSWPNLVKRRNSGIIMLRTYSSQCSYLTSIFIVKKTSEQR